MRVRSARDLTENNDSLSIYLLGDDFGEAVDRYFSLFFREYVPKVLEGSVQTDLS